MAQDPEAGCPEEFAGLVHKWVQEVDLAPSIFDQQKADANSKPENL